MAMTISGTSGLTYPSGATEENASIGYSQTKTNVLASRALSTNYTNSTGRPIVVYAAGNTALRGQMILSIDGNISQVSNGNSAGTIVTGVSAIIPVGSVYQIYAATNGVTLTAWYELR